MERAVTDDARGRLRQRIDSDPDSVARDLFKLVLSIIELVRQLMEAQALRRVDQGDLTDEQVEALGLGLQRLEEAMEELKSRYGLTTADLTTVLLPDATVYVCGSPGFADFASDLLLDAGVPTDHIRVERFGPT